MSSIVSLPGFLQSLPAIHAAVTTPILVEGLRSEIEKTGIKKAVVGVSGGIDSALSLALTCQALGKENVLAIFMPYKLSSEASVSDARLLCQQLGVESILEEITPMADGYINNHPQLSKLQIGNILARLRMIVLYDYSALKQALVVGTSNKTEMLVGYSTLWGDMACAVNPLGDLYKTQVRELSRYLKIPDAILDKPPSADLWPGQTDEAEMDISYEYMDAILYHFIELQWPIEKILAAVDATLRSKAEMVLKRVARSQFKRKMPVILKVSSRTIDREFRMPRDWGI